MYNLSIIIPHYNSVKSLNNLLGSIPKRKNIQIIVVDDKSEQKNYLKENEEYDHVLFLNNDRDKKGAGTCRNIGLSYATGEWVLFADADDFFIEGFYNVISKYFDSKNDVIFFKPTSIEVDTNKKSNRHLRYEKLIDEYLDQGTNASIIRLKFLFFVPWSKLIRKEFIQSNNIIFDEVIASNDVMFSTKIGYYMKKFTVASEVIYCVTKDLGTLTTNSNSKVNEARINVFIKNYRFLHERLKKKEFKTLHLHGLGLLIDIFRRGFGFKKVTSVFFLLKKNKINIFESKMFNPLLIFHKGRKLINKHLSDKKYLKNKRI